MRAMKDSGIEWIGEIPEEWNVLKNKYILDDIYSGGTPTSSNDEFYSEDGVAFVSIGDMTKGPIVVNTKKKITEKGINDKKLRILKAGTLVYSIYATIGEISELGIDATISQAVLALYPKKCFNKKLYKYNLIAMKEFIFFEARGNTQFNLNAEKVKNFFFVQPKEEDQKHIVDFLISKCSKLDSIIAKEQEVIAKLQEYKLSLITEKVTKGFNPNVEMKDSGIEFLSLVPNTWSVGKFRYFIEVKSNLVNPEEYCDYPQVAPDIIEKNSAKLIGYRTVKESGVMSWNHLFFKGQIIYSKIRPILNKLVVAPYDGLCSADMYPIETKNNSKFVVYLMLSHYFTSQVALITEDRVKMPKINQNELCNLMVAIPPLEEQQAIASYLDTKCAAIDAAIAKKQALIEKFTEYKKSLIYEVVTGKKEV